MGDSKLVVGIISYFIALAALLTMAGYGDVGFQMPAGVPESTDAASTEQSFVGAVLECVVTIFGDCSVDTQTQTFKSVAGFFTGVAHAIIGVINFAISAFRFLFQLLTFQIPRIPIFLQVVMVGPGAAGLAFIALKTIRGSGD